MSYKAFASIKEHLEIEMIKKMSPEDINAAMNSFYEKIQQLQQQNQEMLGMLKKVWNVLYDPEEVVHSLDGDEIKSLIAKIEGK